MSSIDNRIVAMKFDNAGFGRGVKETTKDLDNLKKNLDFDGSKKSLEGLSDATKGFSLKGMADGLDNISSKFSILGAIGFTVIQSLTTSVLGFAKKIGGALLNPLVEGGKKRALAIEQAKFQFRGLGMDVDKTMASALAAVKGTAYGLDDAAKAASMFGASGMRAGKDMTGALRGIAGVAAMSGSSYEDVANVFTKVAGQGRLMGDDLNRLASRGVNAAATLGKAMGKTESQVREMVTKGQISFEDFSKAMDGAFGKHATEASKTYAGALANMKAALSRIGASVATPSYEALRKVFNALTPVIDDVATALGPFIDSFTKASSVVSGGLVKRLNNINLDGFMPMMRPIIDTLKNLGGMVSSVIKPIASAFKDIFPGPSLHSLYMGITAIRDFTAGLKLGGENADNLKRTFRGVFAVLDIVWQVIKGVATGLGHMIGALSGSSGGILDFTGNLGDFLVSVDEAIKKGDIFTKIFGVLGHILALPIRLLGVLGTLLSGLFTGFSSSDANGTTKAIGRVGDRLNGFWETLQKVGDGIKALFGGIRKVLEPAMHAIGEAFSGLGAAIADSMSSGNFSAVLDLINTALLGGILLMVRKFFKSGGKFSMMFGLDSKTGILGSIKSTFGQLTGSMKAMQQQIKAKTLMMIAGAIAMLTVSVVALSMIDSAKLTKALTAMAVGFGQLLAAMAILVKISGATGFLKVPAISAAMILLATAIVILATAVRILSGLSWGELARGLTGVAALLLVISVAAKPLGANSKGMIRAGLAMIPLAIGINLLARAVKSFTTMSWGDMAKGLVGVAGSLLIVAAAMWVMPPHMLLTAVALLAVGESLKLIATAMSRMGDLTWGEIAKGLVGMAGALLIIAGAMWLMPPHMLLMAAGLVIVATALKGVAKVMTTLGGMTWGEIAKGLVALAGALLILAGGLYLMSGTLAGSAALFVAAAALAVLTPVLITLGSMSWGAIVKGLVAVAAAFVIIGLAGLLLTPIIVPILALSAALLLTGAGLALAGAGALAFSAAMTALAVTGTAAAAAITAILGAVIGLIPLAMKKFGEGIVQFAVAISAAGPAFFKAFTTVLGSLLDSIAKLAPKIRKTLTALISMLAGLIKDNAWKINEAGWALFVALLNGIRKHIDQAVDIGTDIIVKFLRGISKNNKRVIDAGFDTVIKFINGAADSIDQHRDALRRAGSHLAASLIEGFVTGLATIPIGVFQAGVSLGEKALSGLHSIIQNPPFPSKAGMLMGKSLAVGFSGGIVQYGYAADKAGAEIGDTAIAALKKSLSDIPQLTEDDLNMNPVIAPVLDLTKLQKDATQIGGLLNANATIADVSYNRASTLSQANKTTQESSTPATTKALDAPIQFIQNNNSPKALSALDIYRATRNQLSLAKEALAK